MAEALGKAPDILQMLHLVVLAERDGGCLTCLDMGMIETARAERERLKIEIRKTTDIDLIDQCDAIAEHLDDLIRYRAEKIARTVGYARPENMIPAEAAYLEALTAAAANLRQAWRIQ